MGTSELSERTKAREIAQEGSLVARSTYGNRYGPTIAVGMRSFFLFVSPYTWLSLRAAANLSRAIPSTREGAEARYREKRERRPKSARRMGGDERGGEIGLTGKEK